jgi:hypothetical protein
MSRSVKETHDQLLNLLGTFESDAVQRRKQPKGIGDVAFEMLNTMLLFARDNFAVLIRNAGRRTVSVGAIGQKLDEFLQRGQ